MAVLYGVGVGPGDPELLTLQAVRIIRESEVIAVPTEKIRDSVAYRIVEKVLPEIEEKELLGIAMPMTKDSKAMEACHERAANLLAKKLDEGKTVAFLTLGDPTVFSTYMYLQQRIEEKGYETRLVNGIASFLAAATKLNSRLVLGEEQLHVIPSTFGVTEAMALPGTKVFMKAGKKLSELKKLLAGTDKKVFFIENCGMEGERIIRNPQEMPEEAGYYSLVLVLDH